MQTLRSGGQRVPLGCAIVLTALLARARVTAATVVQKLDTIMFEEVVFEDAELKAVIDYLRREAKRRDPEGKGVNFFLKLDQGPGAAWRNKRVDLELANVPLGAVVHYVCMSIGLHCKTDDRTVLIGDHTMAPGDMRTRSYKLKPGMLNPKRTRKKKHLKSLDGDRD